MSVPLSSAFPIYYAKFPVSAAVLPAAHREGMTKGEGIREEEKGNGRMEQEMETKGSR